MIMLFFKHFLMKIKEYLKSYYGWCIETFIENFSKL